MDIPYFFEAFRTEVVHKMNDANHHHMIHVLRMKNEDSFWLTNGLGVRYLCRITAIHKKECLFETIEKIEDPKPERRLHLAIAFTKNPARMEWLLEKATEIGIECITPIITERSEKHFFKRERYEKIMQSAMLQSKQSYLPILAEATPLTELLPILTEDQRFIAHCMEVNDKTALPSLLKKGQSACICIGPEGDFTSSEVEQTQQFGFIPVGLGPNRLRTETAGLWVCVAYSQAQLR